MSSKKNSEPPSNRQQQQQTERCRPNPHGMPAHLRRTLFPPPPMYPGIPNHCMHMDITNPPPNYRPPSIHPPPVQLYGSSDTFSLCYTLSDEQNTLARQIFEQFRAHPLIPNHMTPRHIVFVYHKPDHQSHPPPQPPQPAQPAPSQNASSNTSSKKDVAVGDYSVVRYDVETQTETDTERSVSSRGDKKRVLHKPLIESKEPSTSNLSEPEMPEFSEAVLKVAKWLKMSQSLGDVFNTMPIVPKQNTATQVVVYSPPQTKNKSNWGKKETTRNVTHVEGIEDAEPTIDTENDGAAIKTALAEECSPSPKKPDTETASRAAEGEEKPKGEELDIKSEESKNDKDSSEQTESKDEHSE